MSTSSAIELDDKELLSLTTSVRKQIVQKLTTGGSLPEDSGSRIFLMQALDGIDKQVMQKAKIKNEEAAIKNQEATSNMVAAILLKTTRTTNMVPNSAPRELPPNIGSAPTVPGQTEIGVINIDPKDIMNV